MIGPGPGHFWSRCLVPVPVLFKFWSLYWSWSQSWSLGLVIKILLFKMHRNTTYMVIIRPNLTNSHCIILISNLKKIKLVRFFLLKVLVTFFVMAPVLDPVLVPVPVPVPDQTWSRSLVPDPIPSYLWSRPWSRSRHISGPGHGPGSGHKFWSRHSVVSALKTTSKLVPPGESRRPHAETILLFRIQVVWKSCVLRGPYSSDSS